MSRKLVATLIINNILNNYCQNNRRTFTKYVIQLKQKQLKRKCLALSSIIAYKRNVPKCKNFMTVINSYPDDVFFSHFRMNRSTFLLLKRTLMPTRKPLAAGRPKYAFEYCLYATLWKLANQCSFREVCDRFGIGMGSLYRIFKKTLCAILTLKKKVIKWPKTLEFQRKIATGFEEKRNNPFPFVLGCIDGTHFKIPAPIEDSSSYINRKGTHSIIMQGVCDSNLCFIDAFVGYPGSCHDAAVWRDSPLRKAIVQRDVNIPLEYHLLGDSAYPLEVHLMAPYRDNGHLTADQRRFNYCHSSNRVFIEQAFGVLKKNFEF